MIERRGKDVFGSPRKPTFRVTLQDIVEATPDVILVSPCGYSAQQAPSIAPCNFPISGT